MPQSPNFIITRVGGGLGYTLRDTDLWGLECALQHALQDGYAKDNEAWTRGMLEKIQTLRR